MKQLSLLFFAFFIAFSAFSQEASTESKWTPREPKKFESTHSGTFNGQKINYKAVVGETFLKNSKGEVTGCTLVHRLPPRGSPRPLQETRSLYLQWRTRLGECLVACRILWSQSGQNRFGSRHR